MEDCGCPHPETEKFKKHKWNNTYNATELFKQRAEEFNEIWNLKKNQDLIWKYYAKNSATYFYEIFNKQESKCPILIPHTVIVSNGVISSWYFTNKKGVVCKKNSVNRNIMEIYN